MSCLMAGTIFRFDPGYRSGDIEVSGSCARVPSNSGGSAATATAVRRRRFRLGGTPPTVASELLTTSHTPPSGVFTAQPVGGESRCPHRHGGTRRARNPRPRVGALPGDCCVNRGPLVPQRVQTDGRGQPRTNVGGHPGFMLSLDFPIKPAAGHSSTVSTSEYSRSAGESTSLKTPGPRFTTSRRCIPARRMAHHSSQS